MRGDLGPRQPRRNVPCRGHRWCGAQPLDGTGRGRTGIACRLDERDALGHPGRERAHEAVAGAGRVHDLGLEGSNRGHAVGGDYDRAAGAKGRHDRASSLAAQLLAGGGDLPR